MNFQKIINSISLRTHKFVNKRRGWKTNRKILVIESDDWGGIRMPNRETYERCLKYGLRVNNSPYNKYDTLASKIDFEHLYSILIQHKDMNGNHPIITANTIVANPDFEKIEKSDFTNYYYESFTDTIKKYPNASFESWVEGIENKLFYPQLHGREHLNIARWLKYLQKPSKELLFAFDNRLFGIGPTISNEGNPSFVQAFDETHYLESEPLSKILTEACELFESIFNYRSQSFIATNYIWNEEVEKYLVQLGVKYLQTDGVQRTNYGNKYHYLGKKNTYNQFYMVRNVIYEPSSNDNYDWNGNALRQIKEAFNLGKPAVVCMHRVNFIGSIFEENRTKNLKLFDELLKEITTRWPDVEFMHSADLGKLMEYEANNQ